jgi:virginiamycin B lyase
MRKLLWPLIMCIGLTIVFSQAGPSFVGAQVQAPAALTGQVTSQEEGPMEGVVVSAKKVGSTITVSVVSDKEGHYGFPENRLDPGHYTLKIRAVGYILDSPATVELTEHKTATFDLKLHGTKNIASQLTNAEWLASIPGTDAQKSYLLGCVGCHTLERIVRSTHDADEFTQVIWRMMSYAQVSQPIKPQQRPNSAERAGVPEQYRRPAEYLATINLSSVSQWEYPLKTLPRPTGRATRVIVTEYDLPRPTVEPHDVIVDEHGMVWYSDFGEQYFGRLDPMTGKVTEWPVPELKPGYPQGALDLEEDKNGDFWLSMMFQGAIAKFDRRTETFKTYSLQPELNDQPAQLNMLGLKYAVDGKVWTNNDGHQDLLRLDLTTQKYEKFEPLKQLPGEGPYSIYGIASDSHNNIYFTEYQTNYIGRIDAKTGETTFYPTPTLHSRPRRVQVDPQDRVWFGEYYGNRVGVFEPKTKQFQEWVVPTPWSGPYDVTWDKNGELWTGGMTTDRVVRLDPKTGKTVEYLMPRETNIRRVFVDNSAPHVTFWTGSNHGAAVVKVEPLD